MMTSTNCTMLKKQSTEFEINPQKSQINIEIIALYIYIRAKFSKDADLCLTAGSAFLFPQIVTPYA